MISKSGAIPFLLLLLTACSKNSEVSQRFPPPISAIVKPYQGKPTIFLDGQPEAPVFYALTDVPGGRWSWEEIPQHNLRNFCEAGIRLFQLDIFLEQLWTAPDTFDISLARHQIRGALEVCPQAAVVFRFHLNAPSWWLAQHPEESVAYEDTVKAEPFEPLHLSRIVQDDSRLPMRASFASEKWRTAATEKLALFCREIAATPEGNALIGIHVANGVYGEWHQWGFIQHEADFSLSMTAHFQKWLHEEYGSEAALQKSCNDPAATFETAAIPTPAERSVTNAGLFRTPASQQSSVRSLQSTVTDYYRCQHELVADNILHFCKTVKGNWPRPILTGAFYGYFFSMFNRQAAGGHLELQKVLQSPWIDYLSGPQVYYPADGYNPGEPYRSRSLVNSVTLHGKLWLDEYDQQPKRTFPILNGQDNAEQYRRNMQENIAALRRNVLSPLTKGAGLWFYDFGPGGMNLNRRNEHDIQSGTAGYWDHPDYLKEIKALKILADQRLKQPWHTDADVLLVYDTEVFYHLKSALPDSCPITSQVVDWLSLAMYNAGVAFDAIHLDDLDSLDLSPYRAIIFANTWLLNKHDKQVIQEKAEGGGRHLFWIYAPGFTDGDSILAESVSEVTGIHLERIIYDKIPTIVPAIRDADLTSQSAWGVLDPLFAVNDPHAQSLANYAHDHRLTAFARKEMKGYTSWYLGIPPIDARWWRWFCQQAGVHIYLNGEGVIYAGGGLLVLHTAIGGLKTLFLKNGKAVELNLPQGPATVVVDAETGEAVMK